MSLDPDKLDVFDRAGCECCGEFKPCVVRFPIDSIYTSWVEICMECILAGASLALKRVLEKL